MSDDTTEQSKDIEKPKVGFQSDEQSSVASPAKKTGFQKGVSGNPRGRPKGALGKDTLVKQAIMAQAEGLLLKNAPKVIATVIEQAKKGCIQSQKLIWQSIIPAKRAVEISAKDDGPAVVKINIQTLEPVTATVIDEVEGEFIEIQDEELVSESKQEEE